MLVAGVHVGDLQVKEELRKKYPNAQFTPWSVRAGGEYPELGQKSHDYPGFEVVFINKTEGWALWLSPSEWLAGR